GPDADGAAGADRGGAGLVGAVLLGITLDDALLIEHAFVADDGQARLGDEDAVVEHPPAATDTDQPPQQALERRPVEKVQEADGMELPHALDPPEPGVVDGADGGRRRSDRFEAPPDQSVV